MSYVKKAVDLISKAAKQRDTAQAMRDLEEIEKSVSYCKKILTREILMSKRKERKAIMEEERKKLYGP